MEPTQRSARGAMRRASRDYTKYLRGSEEVGSGTAHESAPPPPPAPPLPPHPHPPPASRSLLAALVLLGLGQVVCSVALFLYFRAQVSGASGSLRIRMMAVKRRQRLGLVLREVVC